MRNTKTMIGALLGCLLLATAALGATDNLRQGWSVTVTNSTGASGTVIRLANAPGTSGDDLATYTVADGDTLVLGPFERPTRWSYTNGLTWTTNQYPALDLTSVGLGTCIASKNATCTETGDGAVHKTVITLASTPVTLADNAGVVAYGGQKLYDFPEGLILIHGAVADLDLALSAAGVNADWDGDVGVGSVTASNNATLSSTEQNVIPTTATPQAAASVTTADAVSTATEAVTVLDGTSTAADLFLNFLVDDADHDVTSTPTNILATGTITLIWSQAGDN